MELEPEIPEVDLELRDRGPNVGREPRDDPVPAPVPVPIPVPVAVPIPGPTPVLDPCPSQIYSDVAISRLLEQCHLGAFNDQVVRHSSIHLYKFHCKPLRVCVYPCIGVHSYRVARCLV